MMLYAPPASMPEKVAIPAAFKVPVPTTVAPFMKLTVPVGEVGIPVRAEVLRTVAVRMTVWVGLAGLGETVRVSAVGCC